MIAELKIKYMNYYWEYGKNPYQVGGNGNGNDSSVESGGRNDGQFVRFTGCKIKAMVLTKFCYNCHC